MGRFAFIVAGLHGAVAVALGAYGAHGMAASGDQAVAWVERGSLYQLVHAVALAAVAASLGAAVAHAERVALGAAALAFALGPALFSGALYALAFTEVGSLGPVAPLGGLAMILGWLALIAVGLLRTRR